VLVILCIT